MDSKKLTDLAASLKDARALSPLELNEIRFSDKKTVITERMMKKLKTK